MICAQILECGINPLCSTKANGDTLNKKGMAGVLYRSAVPKLHVCCAFGERSDKMFEVLAVRSARK
jgi:hypothetical protein